ncbi:hypothetical protein CEQ90_10810 [Lewinellaceae bacterium SD302]|nr:hypothetical protein CEQ90_10810 [Lewinellaceae bacterium SD302]
MKAASFSQYVYRQLALIRDHDELDRRGKIKALRNLLLKVFELATEADRLHFNTIYARIAYVAHRNGFSGKLIYQLHRFRRGRLQEADEATLRDLLLTGYKVILDTNLALFQQPLREEWLAENDQPYPISYREPDVVGYRSGLRVVALEFDEHNQQLYVREEERPTDTWRIAYGEEAGNEHVRSAVNIVRQVTGLPVILNLLQVEVHQNRLLNPRQIVIEPDYLIDVTAVASAFSSKDETQPWASLSRKLLPYEQRLPLLKGNVVNMFLDVLVNDPDTSFTDLTKMIFQTQPLGLCCLRDEEVKRLIHELRKHYGTLRRIVSNGLGEQNIDREDSQLEPSFYSPAFGLQGRLDLLHRGEDQQGNDQTSIIELKSGKIFMPNRHGLNQSHFVQTLLYDLMINDAYGKEANVASYILYSQADERPLRYAPPERFTQFGALAIRNQVLAIELLITQLGLHPTDDLLVKTNALIRRLRPTNFKRLSPFTEQDFVRVIKGFELLDDLEKRYFGAFLGFTAREHRLAKTGEQGSEKLNGLASLWLDESEDKADAFEMLSGLTLQQYDPDTGTVTFQRRSEGDRMVKFRTGDIVVLYATETEIPLKGEVLKSQVFKSTIIGLGPDQLSLRLRSRQLSDKAFRNRAHWAIEKDVLDSSFSNHYRGLWAWAESMPRQRKILLGLEAPRRATTPEIALIPDLTTEQNRIVSKLLAAPDYFLLWGPPGTGKTSMMLHHTLAHLLDNSQENILIVAYTNRAVDEICESIERINGGFRDYLRIGSRFGTAAAYQDRLLSVRSEKYSSRAELIEMLETTRVYVGTVASVGGKEELFKLKQFDRIIVDEASQILEPLLLGLLSRIPRALLIGDHRQLPAVVQQRPEESMVYDAELREAGITDLGTSLFERLYRKAKNENWEWCYDQLRFQGRMHRDIMAFPARVFYGGTLDILPEEIRQRERQQAPLELGKPADNSLAQLLATRRLTFIPTGIDYGSSDRKTNRHEAEQVIRTIQCMHRLYDGHPTPLLPGDIGIITPYRAQIANLRRHLQSADLDPDNYTVDTVERYQGGARRIIIISLCTNDQSQMSSLAQTNEEGIDRKLNVAMTRAREQLILIGCPEVLRAAPHYGELLDFIEGQ